MPKKAGLGAPAQAMRQATLSLGTFVALNTPSATHSERTGSAQTRSETSTPISTSTPFSPSISGSATSSILSSASAYERRSEKAKKLSYETFVKLDTRMIAGGAGISISLSLKRKQITIPNLKNKRQKYSEKEKEQILLCAHSAVAVHDQVSPQ